jgi:citrate lyase subunit alpha/citrate CoA-transferase
MALRTAAEMGIKDLMWFPSASFPCHEPVIELMDRGVVHHIEGSMNGPLGEYTSRGKMRGLGVLRSHGGRWQAIQDGEVKIDVAVIAAPTADAFGNADGSHGPSACGSLGFALADSMYAEHVIVGTDKLGPRYWQAREQGKTHEALIHRHDNPLWEVIRSEFRKR